eukprot:gnl/MRDRNA2_/MRDRNA2_89904_c0_seq1.p1 gnl/MRDRNA2_/MRDRNA2_89904_c0~~gnl/MRDRNA2_/MRDRNA2_89904_c0_seq1.p1  ORF type:complete len:234 (-),score=20.19 gnl/MRDRNA2_/MRDRNA2_89904_c0_seq1:45-746(-)
MVIGDVDGMTPPPVRQHRSHFLDPLHMCEAQVMCPTDHMSVSGVFNACEGSVALERSEADIQPPKVVQGRWRHPLRSLDTNTDSKVEVQSVDCWSGASPSSRRRRTEFFTIGSPGRAHTCGCFGAENVQYHEGMSPPVYRLDYDDTPVPSPMKTPLTKRTAGNAPHKNADVATNNHRHTAIPGYDPKPRSCEPCSFSLRDCFDVGPREQPTTVGDWWFTPTKQPYRNAEGYDL